MYFSYPFFIKFYYFYSAIVALKFKLSRKRSRINFCFNFKLNFKAINKEKNDLEIFEYLLKCLDYRSEI
jgi:hypothetical protein